MTGKLLHKYIYWLGCVVFIILLSGCQNTTEPPEPDTVAIFEGGKVTRQELKEAIDELEKVFGGNDDLQKHMEVAKRVLQWRWLIIDEISMVSARLLATMDMEL